jgi:hypothetical protein
VKRKQRLIPATIVVTSLAASDVLAVDKVYHPYVEPLERELEYRFIGFSDGEASRDIQLHRFGVGYGVNDHIAVDAYLTGEKEGGDALKVETAEIELLWQLNEQGSQWLDSALQFEIEHSDGGYNEFSAGFIAEKEIGGQWSATANLLAHYETGPEPKDNFEGELAAQLRYRLKPQFEPAIEAYWDEDVTAIGPAAIGTLQMAGRNRLKWEAAALQSTKHTLARRIFRFSLEWEF